MSKSDKYGPPPPPPLPEGDANDDKDDDDDDDDGDDGDAFMPSLPPHMRKHSERKTTPPSPSPSPSPPAGGGEQESGSEDGDEYCPALPPHMMPGGGGGGATVGGGTRGTGVGTNSKTQTNAPTAKQSAGTKRVLGPTLPDFAIPKDDSTTPVKEQLEEEEEEGEEDVPVIGPLPPAVKVSREEYRAREFEERARRMKDKLEGRNVDTNKPLVRESWMTELPEDKPNFCGLGARQFLRKTPAEKGDRSCWTDTPADRARKEKEKQKATEGTSVEEEGEEEEAEDA